MSDFICWCKIGSLCEVKRSIIPNFIDYVDEKGKSGLIWACENGHHTVASFLLDNGADLDVVDQCRSSALFYATKKGHLSICTLLLERGANINAIDSSTRTVLSYACENGHEDLCALYLDHLADPNIVDWTGMVAFLYACDQEHGLICRMLVESGDVNPFTTSLTGKSSLMFAAENGDLSLFSYLLSKGCAQYLSAVDQHYKTTLMYAAENGYLDICQLILEHHPELLIDDTDWEGKTALIYSALHNFEDICCELIGKGADPYLKDDDHNSALSLARIGGNQALYEVMLREKNWYRRSKFLIYLYQSGSLIQRGTETLHSPSVLPITSRILENSDLTRYISEYV